MSRKRLFKYESGAATQFISRRRARKKLQLSLADFRRLCILKGIYPHEPKNKKKVNKGSTAPRTFYFKKDIDFLAHEPLIQKFRQHKAIIKKLKRATGRKEFEKAEKIRDTLEDYDVDHIVLERYPNFVDALRDLDDALTLVCLFASFPQSKKVHSSMIQLCERLRTEWHHYVIESKCLRKCFISIKGIYLQASVMNETITWVLPHSRAYAAPSDVDFRVMSTFADFYTSLVGFTLFQLFKRDDLVYPPQCIVAAEEDVGKTSNQDQLRNFLTGLVKAKQSEGEEPTASEEPLETLDAEQQKLEAEEVAVTTLFSPCTFFFNREAPIEVLTVICRALGASIAVDENDSAITHQIIDRPQIDMTHEAKRSYLQPQWIFDSVNAGILMPVARYLPGAELPAHLSPFVKDDGYKPPERLEIEALQRGEDPGLIFGASAGIGGSEGEEEEDENADAHEPELEIEESEGSESDSDHESESDQPPSKRQKGKAQSAKVSKGTKDNPRGKHADQDAAEEKRLAKTAMSKKMKWLDSKIQHSNKKEKRKNEKLSQKRKAHDSKPMTRTRSGGRQGLMQPAKKQKQAK